MFAKFGQNWSRSSGKEHENVKKNSDRRTDGQATVNQKKNLTLAISLSDLKTLWFSIHCLNELFCNNISI